MGLLSQLDLFLGDEGEHLATDSGALVGRGLFTRIQSDGLFQICSTDHLFVCGFVEDFTGFVAILKVERVVFSTQTVEVST